MVLRHLYRNQAMLHPLASLWRHSGRVTFYESGGQIGQALLAGGGPGGQAHVLGSRRRFSSSDDAYTYLRFWMGEPAARAELKWILQRSGPSLASANAGADGWLHALAARLTSGAIVALEETSRYAMPGRLVAPASASMSAAAVSALPTLAEIATIAVLADLLPALEDVRIEGAEVLPELNQSIEQVEAAIASVSAASLSLEPAPSKIAAIRTAIADASAKATAALGEL
jgi:hypothetical protein